MKKTISNINLCEILKGHEGETFYWVLNGAEVILNSVKYNIVSLKIDENYGVNLLPSGAAFKGGEVLLFPSKDQRDWNKWDKENNHKTPKTWSELIKYN